MQQRDLNASCLLLTAYATHGKMATAKPGNKQVLIRLWLLDEGLRGFF